MTEQNDCEAVAVIVANPQDAVPTEATVVHGDETKQVTVAPGTTERVLFPMARRRRVTFTS